MQLTLPPLLAQARALRFDDASLEEAFHVERNESDVLRIRRTLLLLFALLLIGGCVIVLASLLQHVPLSRTWLILRFGLLLPVLLLFAYSISSDKCRRNMELFLAAGLSVIVGVFALEWILDWSVTMPPRTIWFTTTTGYITAMALFPVTRRVAIAASIGALGIALCGCLAILPRLGWTLFFINAAVYLAMGWLMVMHVGWREGLLREMFLHRREVQCLAEELRGQNDVLKKLIAQRDEFVAGVLHDLRSPLTAIQLSIEFLRADRALIVDDQFKLLDQIAFAAKRVEKFANRFLEQRSLERAAATPTLLEVPLDPVVSAAVEHARVHAASKGQCIEIRNLAPCQMVVADELLLDRALGNLLDNAIKYSPHGSTIAVRMLSDPVEPSHLRILVTDTGPGLSKAELGSLFQPYVKLGKRPTGNEPSTGLGLSLVKHCIKSMGGEVGCESELGHGATFWLALRCTKPTGAVLPQSQEKEGGATTDSPLRRIPTAG